MKLRIGPDLDERFVKLAALLNRQPFDPETERRFNDKWTQLADEYESVYPDMTPPLLEFADNDWNTKVRWPRGWR